MLGKMNHAACRRWDAGAGSRRARGSRQHVLARRGVCEKGFPIVVHLGFTHLTWLMSDSFSTLRNALSDFDDWASTFTDQRSSDWPTEYPAMSELVYAAASAMLLASEASVTSDEELALIARVWSLTEEPESMVDVAIEVGPAVVPVLRRLFAVGDHEARWQIVSAVPRLGVPDVELIEFGMRDVHAYVRRRAWLALHEVAAPLAVERAKFALASERDAELRRVLTQIIAEGRGE